MAETLSGKVQEAGNAVKQGVKKAGNRIAEKAEEVQDWAKQKLNKAENRTQEMAEQAKDEAEVARADEEAKKDNCGCG
jgi:F0F1-type ATP synthase membrane subunit b/b'